MLTDSRSRRRRDGYERGRWTFALYMHYPMVELPDYEDRRAELEASRNPFAVVVLAQPRIDARRRSRTIPASSSKAPRSPRLARSRRAWARFGSVMCAVFHPLLPPGEAAVTRNLVEHLSPPELGGAPDAPQECLQVRRLGEPLIDFCFGSPQ